MNNTTPPNKLHPLLAAAAGSVIIASAVGIAAMTGLLTHDEKPVPTPVAVSSIPAPTVAAQPVVAPVVVAAPTPEKVEVKKEVVVTHRVHHKAAVHKTVAQAETSSSASQEHYVAPKAVCMDCGTVLAVQPVVTESKPSGMGAVGGAILGGVLGHQFGGGDGKKAMTAAGVIGGAMAGNQIEKSQHKITSYDVTVQMEDGSTRNFSYDTAPSVSSGEHVRVSGNQLISN